MTAIASEAAPAKVNLFLHVEGQRVDGRHDLTSKICFVALADEVALLDGPPGSLTLSGPFAQAIATEPNNLVLCAAEQLANWAGIRLQNSILLEKNIPVAAGLGGGSADAAAILRLLCRQWTLDCFDPAVVSIAAGLGADVPMCLYGQPAIARGVGDQLETIDLPAQPIVLVNPNEAVSTAAVFGAYKHLPTSGERNDLTEAACQLCPTIGLVLEALSKAPSCRLARMSGSGATCFALTKTEDEATALAASIRQAHPHWWVWAGMTRPNSL